MRYEVRDNFFHDLRAPLARARTYGKLLMENSDEERKDLTEALMQALDELERLLRQEEEKE